jgi:hypothetical protein
METAGSGVVRFVATAITVPVALGTVRFGPAGGTVGAAVGAFVTVFVVGVAVCRGVVGRTGGAVAVALTETRVEGVVDRTVGDVVARGAWLVIFATGVAEPWVEIPATGGTVTCGSVTVDGVLTVWWSPQVGVGVAATAAQRQRPTMAMRRKYFTNALTVHLPWGTARGGRKRAATVVTLDLVCQL